MGTPVVLSIGFLVERTFTGVTSNASGVKYIAVPLSNQFLDCDCAEK